MPTWHYVPKPIPPCLKHDFRWEILEHLWYWVYSYRALSTKFVTLGTSSAEWYSCDGLCYVCSSGGLTEHFTYAKLKCYPEQRPKPQICCGGKSSLWSFCLRAPSLGHPFWGRCHSASEQHWWLEFTSIPFCSTPQVFIEFPLCAMNCIKCFDRLKNE